ncbi:MAG: 50S ribosomal protein L23 [Patescibacteria group bacterium]
MGLFSRSKKDTESTDEIQSSVVDETSAPIKTAEPVVKVAKNDKSVKVGKSTIQPEKVIVCPWVTEKVTDLQKQDKYAFVVDPKANKIMVALAVKILYGVKPLKVNLIKVKGKTVRRGRTSGQTKDWRKAIITLKPGDKIGIFEGV